MLKHAWARTVTRRRLWDERGATAIEYALLAALIAAIVAVGVTTIGLKTNDMFNTVTNGF
jgi:pilus assembly protein Flp/PilA